jgi:hypothetical protein
MEVLTPKECDLLSDENEEGEAGVAAYGQAQNGKTMGMRRVAISQMPRLSGVPTLV